MEEVRAMTPMFCGLSWPNWEIISSVIPSLMYSCFASLVRFRKGRTNKRLLEPTLASGTLTGAETPATFDPRFQPSFTHMLAAAMAISNNRIAAGFIHVLG